MLQRYFRAEATTYDGIRLYLNAAWGMPTPGTANCILPADDPTAPRDAQGLVYLAVHADWCEWPAVEAVLPDLLASGAVEEVTREDYLAALPVGP